MGIENISNFMAREVEFCCFQLNKSKAGGGSASKFDFSQQGKGFDLFDNVE